jgi:hypothetical protein
MSTSQLIKSSDWVKSPDVPSVQPIRDLDIQIFPPMNMLQIHLIHQSETTGYATLAT